MKYRRLALCLLAGLVCAGPGRAATLTATNAGIGINAGTFGTFTLTYPALDVGAEKPLAPIEKTVVGDHATLRYTGGAHIEVTVAGDEITYSLTDPPAELKSLRTEMLIDFAFREGGTWQMGAARSQPFPNAKPASPHLYQGNPDTFTLTNFEGKRLVFTLPANAYAQLTDNREWNWNIFNWLLVVPFDRNSPRYALRVQEQNGNAKRVIVVDRFGQDAVAAFPGKVRSESELKADLARDAAYYGSLHPPARDTYGGLPGSRQRLGLRQTGFFHVEKHDGRWLLVDPAGNACFHLGICGFQPSDDYTYIKGRQPIYDWLPDYDGPFRAAYHPDRYWSRDVFSFYVANLIRKYGRYDANAFAARMIDRVRRFGFNAVGAFSSVGPAHRAARFPWVDALPLDEWALGGQIEGLRGLFDPFDPKVAAKMDQLFARSVHAAASEPLLIGYFLGNEQAFEDIPRVIPGLKGDRPAKQALVRLLRERYPTIAAFNVAWNTTATSFDDLLSIGLPVATKAAAADMSAYTERFIDAYYRLIRTTFRKYDRNHMIIGNRWQPITANNEALCRIAGRYCEMLSLNYYTYGVDKAFLKRLYDWGGGRPFMLSEFYWASPRESGLPGGSEVKTQQERGLAYRNYVEQAASTGFVVGIEWFILIDQARTGRWFEQYNGERANTGLFSVADRPYRDFLAGAMQTNYAIYDVLLGRRPPFAWNDPRFQPRGAGPKSISIPRAAGTIALNGRRDGWPGTPPETVSSSRLVIGADGAGFDGSFRLCWDDHNLYVMVQITDPTPMRNDQQGGELWNGDSVELFVGPEQPDREGPLLFTDRQVLLSPAGRSYIAHAPGQVPCRVAATPALDGKGYQLEAAIPFAALGFTPRDGQMIRFDLAIDDGNGAGRQRQLMWSGVARNSGDRTAWGRARFVR